MSDETIREILKTEIANEAYDYDLHELIQIAIETINNNLSSKSTSELKETVKDNNNLDDEGLAKFIQGELDRIKK